MLDVTFMISPLMKLSDFPIASRVITSNLEFNNKINPSYSNAVIITNSNYKENLDLDVPSSIYNYLKRRNQYLFNHFVLNSDKMKKSILNSVKTDIVIFSSLSIDGLHIVKLLLNNGNKVVIGGAFCFIYSRNTIARILMDFGVSKDKLKNLIIIKGYIDLTTDLYTIIKKWEDVDIKNNNLYTTYECEQDYLLDSLPLLKMQNINPGLNFSFKQVCPYLKCKYCNHKYLPDVSFIGDPERIISRINKSVSLYKTDRIFITDSYCMFDDDVTHIMEGIKHNKLSVFTGIKQLKSKRVIQCINKYVETIFVGLETTVDFTLSFISKGYDYDTVLTAVENIIKFMDRDKRIYFNVILDLPVSRTGQVYINYNRLKELKQRFELEGFTNFHFNPHALTVDPRSAIIDGILLKITDTPLNGENFVLSHIENYPFLPRYADINVARYDLKGKHIPSDFQLIDTSFLLE